MLQLEGTAFELYTKAKRFGTWDPQAIDLGQDRQQFAALDDDAQEGLIWFCSAFHGGEETVAATLGAWILATPTFTDQMFLSTQLFEEMKHTEFFARYFAEVFAREPQSLTSEGRDLAWAIGTGLDELAEALQRSVALRPDQRERLLIRGVVHYHLIVEGVIGMSAYDSIGAWLGERGILPGLEHGFAQIRADEGRHISYGVDFVRRALANDAGARDIVRETFCEVALGAIAGMNEAEQARARVHLARRASEVGVLLEDIA